MCCGCCCPTSRARWPASRSRSPATTRWERSIRSPAAASAADASTRGGRTVAPLELSCVLAWKPTLRIERVHAGAAFLIGERERFALSGPTTVAIAMLVDGQRTVHDILQAARADAAAPEALYALSQLVARGHLVPAAPDLRADHMAFWAGAGLDGRAALEALRAISVSVRILGDTVALASMTEALEQAGLRVDGGASAHVIATDDHLAPELASINRSALRDGTRWFLIKP